MHKAHGWVAPLVLRNCGDGFGKIVLWWGGGDVLGLALLSVVEWVMDWFGMMSE